MRVLIALLSLSAAALAADVSGTWTGQAPGRGGKIVTQTYTFKVEGNKLIGTVAGPAGELPVYDGKVEGDQISFKQATTVGAMNVTLRYTGLVKGDTIEMKRTAALGRGAVTFTLKRMQ
jgi:hypothetical protein